MAARGGSLEVLQYARENGCLWDVCSMYKNMTISAVIGGNVECLKYVLAQKCSMDAKACEIAAQHGHVEILKYLRPMGSTCVSRVSFD